MTDTNTTLAKVAAPEDKGEKALTRITNYMSNPIVVSRFNQMMGQQGAASYINSVILVVANSPALQKCSLPSIYTQALRAGTLRLSVDPGIGQAYMVPFGDEATLIIGYKGLHDLAVRTGRYRYINVGPVYEGEEVEEDRLTGFHKPPRAVGPIDKTRIIGWLGAFEMFPEKGMKAGYAKTLYMTVEEITEHARKYSKGYDYKDKNGNFTSLWHKEEAKMQRKTVLRLLLRKWGYLDPSDVQTINEVESDDDKIIEGKFSELTESLNSRAPEEPKRSAAQNISQLGFDTRNPDPIDEKDWTAYLALANRAEKVDVPYKMPERETTTASDLRTEYGELLKFVTDAERQAEIENQDKTS